MSFVVGEVIRHMKSKAKASTKTTPPLSPRLSLSRALALSLSLCLSLSLSLSFSYERAYTYIHAYRHTTHAEYVSGDQGSPQCSLSLSPRIPVPCPLQPSPLRNLQVELNVGGCQNYGNFLGNLNIRCRTTLGTQKGTIFLTTTHVLCVCYDSYSRYCCFSYLTLRSGRMFRPLITRDTIAPTTTLLQMDATFATALLLSSITNAIRRIASLRQAASRI